MGKRMLPNAADHQDEFTDDTLHNRCPFLLQHDPTLLTPQDLDASIPNVSPLQTEFDEIEQPKCYAVPTPFVPSTVHQRSCCLNPAAFMRCPHYIEVMGEQKRQIDFRLRKRSASSWLRNQISRLFPLGRSPHKRRKRVYYTI